MHSCAMSLMWRTRSCVPRRDSSRRLLRSDPERSHECERGTQECVRHYWSGPGTSYTQRTGHIVDTFEDDKGGDNDALESERCDGRTSTVCDGMGKPRLESGRVVSGLRNYEKYGI